MAYYGTLKDVDELISRYNIIVEKKDDEKKDEEKDDIKLVNDRINDEVIYADLKKVDNIFKHIVVFTNSRERKDNKTLDNIYEAIDNLKKAKCDIIPELHVFVAAKVDCDDDEREIKIEDDENEFTIKEHSNTDTLIISRLGVQGEDECEHIVELLQDRGFLVLNPIRYAQLASNKYDTACLLQKAEIPQPNFCLMTKEILNDEKLYNQALKEVNKKYDPKGENDEISVVVKILDGHGGTGVFLIKCDKLMAVLQAIFAIDPERQLIIQSKEESDGGDIRVHVLTLRDKQVILGAMKRVKLGKDFRSNVSLGAEAEPVKLTKEQEEIALKCAKVSRLPWCAVDIMPLVKGSNKKLGDNVVLELNASPGTDGISEVLGVNFVNVMLSELTNPSQFLIQRKVAGYREAVEITFKDGVTKTYLGKLDTGNGSIASVVEVGDYKVNGDKISFSVDGKQLEFDIVEKSNPKVGTETHERYVIKVDCVKIGLRQMKDVKFAVIKSREKSTNVLINRELLSFLSYTVASDETHILTDEIEKINIV
jgi:RimK family alpha-L-glutamate ligase